MRTNKFKDIFSDAEWEAIQARLNRPAQERFDELVEAGIIDREGKVLIRMPTFGPDEDEEAEDTAD